MESNEPQIIKDPAPIPNKRGTHGVFLSVLLALILVLVVICVVISAHDRDHKVVSSSITPAVVSIGSSGFVPQVVTIQAGQAVTWTNNDISPHQIASDPYPSD